MQCSDCNTVMFKLPQVGYPHANTVMPYGVKTGSTDSCITEDDMWREKWAGKPSVNMTNYVDVCKRNHFLQKQHTTWRKKIFRNESSVARGKPEQKPRARRTWKYLFFFFDTLLRVYTSIFLDLLIWQITEHFHLPFILRLRKNIHIFTNCNWLPYNILGLKQDLHFEK